MRANSTCLSHPCRFRTGAAGIVTSLVVCALLTGCSAQAVVSTTVPAATATTRPVPRVLVTSVPIVACPTTFGVSLPTIRLPAFVAIAVPADFANRLAVYSDTRGIIRVVGPKGWDCRAGISVDGQGTVEVFPATERTSSGAPFAELSEAVVGHETSACVGCAMTQACVLFTSAAAAAVQNGYPVCSSPPPGQQATQLSATAVAFEDPPGVQGAGNPSGGTNPADGVMTYAPYSNDGSWIETCTLPVSDHSLCQLSLNLFVSSYGNR